MCALRTDSECSTALCHSGGQFVSTELHVPDLIILTISPWHISIATCIRNLAQAFMQVTQTPDNNESSLI